MENKVLKLGNGGERSTLDVHTEIKNESSNRWAIQSQKTKYVNGKSFEVIEVGYTTSFDNPGYILKEDKSNNQIQITAQNDGTSGLCVLTQNESGNKIKLQINTPEYWKICFTPIILVGVNMDMFFMIGTNISGEGGSLADGAKYNDWIVNQNRNTIKVYISHMYPGVDVDMLSWSCFDKNGNAFSPNYNLPDNSYFTTKTTGLGSYTLTKISIPPADSYTPILLSSFNPNKKYKLDLNFYWGAPPQE